MDIHIWEKLKESEKLPEYLRALESDTSKKATRSTPGEEDFADSMDPESESSSLDDDDSDLFDRYQEKRMIERINLLHKKELLNDNTTLKEIEEMATSELSEPLESTTPPRIMHGIDPSNIDTEKGGSILI